MALHYDKKQPDESSIFNFEIDGKTIKCLSTKEDNYQYAVANDRGEIILKDYFKKEVSINIADFEPGPYKIVVLNEAVKEDFIFYIN